MSTEDKEKFVLTIPNDTDGGNKERNPFVRQMVEELTRCDFMEDSPTVTGLEGELKAKNEHLGDMRKLVFSEDICVSRVSDEKEVNSQTI